MPKREFDLLVFVGRFQPPHNGHFNVINTALAKAQHVLILVGSANLARTTHNPFTYDERRRMLELGIGMDKWVDQPRVTIEPLDDVYDDDEWVQQVQEAAWHAVRYSDNAKIGLIGRNKDASSYYLRLFPQWGSVDVQSEEYETLDATSIRRAIFNTFNKEDDEQWNLDEIQKYLLGEGDYYPADMPPGVAGKVMAFRRSDEFKDLIEEHRFCENYKLAWADAPYTPTFNTVDAVCVQSGQILLVTRKAHPGKGKFALPGGFVQPDERLLQSAMRELKEETKIDLPPAVLRSSVKGHKIFDAPHRDPRGRFISTAFLFDLPKSPRLPAVKGSDDAAHAAWYDVTRIQTEDLFIDHHNIIKSMMRLL